MPEQDALLIGPYRKGEVPIPVVVTFKDYQGNAVGDISAYSVRWIYRRHSSDGWPDFTSGDPVAVIQTGSIFNGPASQAQYVWTAADFATIGYFEGEMWIGNLVNRFSSRRYLWQTVDAISVPSI